MTQLLDSLQVVPIDTTEPRPEPTEFFLDAPSLVRVWAGGAFSKRIWFDVLATDMITLEFAVELSQSKDIDPISQAFTVMSMLIKAWNVKLFSGEIAPITRKTIMQLPAQMITPLVDHVAQVQTDFLAWSSPKPNPASL